MKRIICVVVVLTVAAFLSQQAQAQITETVLGGFQWRFGTDNGYIWPMAAGDRDARNGQFGLMWSEPVTVYSLSFKTFNDTGNRAIPGVVYIYTSRFGEPVAYKLEDAKVDKESSHGEYVLNFPQGLAVDHSYLMVVVRANSMASAGDGWVGIHINSIHGVNVVSQGKGPDFNLNDPANNVLKKNMEFLPGTLAPQYGNDPGIANDLSVASGIQRPEYTRDAIFFDGPGSENGKKNDVKGGEVVGLVATYTTGQSIGSVGLGFAGDAGDRITPDTVTIIATFFDPERAPVELTINIKEGLVDGEKVYTDISQYARYDLDARFVDVETLTLKIVMPSGNYGYLGVTEFQAFRYDWPIPEPATITLLALGGLAMLRRR